MYGTGPVPLATSSLHSLYWLLYVGFHCQRERYVETCNGFFTLSSQGFNLCLAVIGHFLHPILFTTQSHGTTIL